MAGNSNLFKKGWGVDLLLNKPPRGKAESQPGAGPGAEDVDHRGHPSAST